MDGRWNSHALHPASVREVYLLNEESVHRVDVASHFLLAVLSCVFHSLLWAVRERDVDGLMECVCCVDALVCRYLDHGDAESLGSLLQLSAPALDVHAGGGQPVHLHVVAGQRMIGRLVLKEEPLIARQQTGTERGGRRR